MKNREIFQRDPVVSKLLNDGVVTMTEGTTSKEIETLRYELEHFVCEGQYKEGLIRILESYLDNLGRTSQPAVWVSGFFGSGKSHLLKMLRHLWVDTKFEDGATARGLARLPVEVKDLLRELDTMGKRYGGLHAAGGPLPSGGARSLRLAILGMIFRSKDLPELLPQARFCLWLRKNGIYNRVKKGVEDRGRDFFQELHHLYASPALAAALLEADPDFAPNPREVRATLRAQFPNVEDVSTTEFIHIVRNVLSVNGQLPCTVIVLDEVQLFISSSAERSYDVQEVAEALCKQLDSRILLIASGQTALSGDFQLLQRLQDRFTISVELSDADIETVTRRVVLAKKVDKRKAIKEMLDAYAGEIDRHLVGSRIAARSEDRGILVDDYPILPVRRRFWEHVLRAVDVPGTSSQLRTQLRIVYDAVRAIADEPLGTVVPADFIFDQLQPNLLRTGVLLREIDETIRNLDDATPEGLLAKRICALIFLIRKLPRDTAVADIGVRATPDMLADLLVSDLAKDGPVLRKEIPRILEKLADEGKLIKLEDEYSLQTRESSEWEREFRNRQTRLNNDPTALSNKRSALLSSDCMEVLGSINLRHGKSKEKRELAVAFGTEPPKTHGTEIPVWIRDGWGENERTVLADARAAGNEDPTIFVYVPKTSAEELRKAIIDYEAANKTLEFKGTPTSGSGKEAHDAMVTRMRTAETTRKNIINEVINAARVFQGGGHERLELSFRDKVEEAARASLDRLFPRFLDADDDRWRTVMNRARNKDVYAFQAIGWNDALERHPVCTAILSEIGPGKTGKDIRDMFMKAPYGWPQDAIDAVLITLFAVGYLRAVYKGVPLEQGQLDQNKISVTGFRVETITISARDRIKLRKLFQEAGVRCTPGEESSAAGQFIAKLLELADAAGGEPPLPERPPKIHLEKMRGLTGNEQLSAILEQYDTLTRQLHEWSALAELAAKRKPDWERLQILLKHAQGLREAEDLQKQAEAVLSERRLLDGPDPVLDILGAVVRMLRTVVNQAYDTFMSVYDQEKAILESNDNWQKLSPEQQERILEAEGIASVPRPSLQDAESVFRSLEETPLSGWKTRTNALPQQFANAALAAAKLLEPKIQKVRLTSSTLKTEIDVRTWISKTEKELLERIRSGPVIIS